MNKFEKIVTNTWGQKGKMWLNKLPNIIDVLSKYWQLTDLKPVSNMSYNYVALAIQENKKPVVLKISCDEQLILHEHKALKHFNGMGAVKVFDINKEYNALLLEQAIPGALLKTHHPDNIEDTIKIYAQVVKAIASHPLPTNNFPHVSTWCKAIDRIKDPRIDKRFVDHARELKTFLLTTSKNEYICHGDLHLENIVQHGKKWLAIDPKGIIGEVTFEAAAFDLISKDELNKDNTVKEKLLRRTHMLSNALNLDFKRLLSWIFLRVIISAQWFIEDNDDPSTDLILAENFYSLLNQNMI